MSDFTCGLLLKLVLWTLYISSEGVSIVNPNRDSPNGYPTVKRAELQPVTLAH